MVSFILDASAVLRYMDGEAGAERVAAILGQYSDYSAEAIISPIHFGEVIGIFYRRHGLTGAQFWMEQFRALVLTVISVDAERAARGVAIKAEYGIPYVDALAVTDNDSSGKRSDHGRLRHEASRVLH
ncbi:PIN domain-containing protein [Granulicella arctica]|uniref:PIN domain-containing protein n=1 Tax=Granulicella arctica TaxID=940613 RepID=UPI0021DF4B6F|nr:PIN domain-containing protein [Granulicella arctica]